MQWSIHLVSLLPHNYAHVRFLLPSSRLFAIQLSVYLMLLLVQYSLWFGWYYSSFQRIGYCSLYFWWSSFAHISVTGQHDYFVVRCIYHPMLVLNSTTKLLATLISSATKRKDVFHPVILHRSTQLLCCSHLPLVDRQELTTFGQKRCNFGKLGWSTTS